MRSGTGSPARRRGWVVRSCWWWAGRVVRCRRRPAVRYRGFPVEWQETAPVAAGWVASVPGGSRSSSTAVPAAVVGRTLVSSIPTTGARVPAPTTMLPSVRMNTGRTGVPISAESMSAGAVGFAAATTSICVSRLPTAGDCLPCSSAMSASSNARRVCKSTMMPESSSVGLMTSGTKPCALAIAAACTLCVSVEPAAAASDTFRPAGRKSSAVLPATAARARPREASMPSGTKSVGSLVADAVFSVVGSVVFVPARDVVHRGAGRT